VIERLKVLCGHKKYLNECFIGTAFLFADVTRLPAPSFLLYGYDYNLFNPTVVPWGLCDPSPLSRTFFETVKNTDIVFYVFFS
jgi:hypothetical protein